MTDADQTPATEDVRESYAMSGEGADFKRVAREREKAFDRWLYERESQAARQALIDAAVAVRLVPCGLTTDDDIVDFLMARAATPTPKEA